MLDSLLLYHLVFYSDIGYFTSHCSSFHAHKVILQERERRKLVCACMLIYFIYLCCFVIYCLICILFFSAYGTYFFILYFICINIIITKAYPHTQHSAKQVDLFSRTFYKIPPHTHSKHTRIHFIKYHHTYTTQHIQNTQDYLFSRHLSSSFLTLLATME